jgi:predicted permease
VDLYARVLDRLCGLPGVAGATLSGAGLIAGSVSLTDIVVPGFDREIANPFGIDSKRPFAFVQVVDPAFFDTIRLPLRLGRPLSDADARGAQRVVVVNDALARLYFPEGSPIGRRFTVGSEDGAPEVEIVGVVADMPYDTLRRGLLPTFYASYRQSPNLGGVTFEIRTATPPLDLVPTVRAAVREIEPRLPLDGVRTEEEQIADSYREERVYATLATTLGAVGVLLAAIGLYGLLAYQVAQRTQELGVRMALGATRGALARLVLAQSIRLAAVGAVLGVLASLAGTRVLSGILFGLTATDPVTLAGAVGLLLAVAVVAGYLPARRAARVDPLVALRTE